MYAIEASGLADLCKEIVRANEFQECIEVIQGRAEDVELPIQHNTADVLVSEWMGFYLLHEAMLSSVIGVRDKWLRRDGLMLPSTATVYMCPVNIDEYVRENLTYWDNTYGFNFTPLKMRIQERNARSPIIENIQPSNCLAQPEQVAHFHLNFVATEDLVRIRRSLTFKLNKYAICHGFAVWFDCDFHDSKDESVNSLESEVGERSKNNVVLSTAPDAMATHWKQTIVLLPNALMVSKGEVLCCVLELQQDTNNSRRYNISLELVDDDSDSDDSDDIDNLIDSVEGNDIKAMILDVLTTKTKYT